MDQDPDWSV